MAPQNSTSSPSQRNVQSKKQLKKRDRPMCRKDSESDSPRKAEFQNASRLTYNEIDLDSLDVALVLQKDHLLSVT